MQQNFVSTAQEVGDITPPYHEHKMFSNQINLLITDLNKIATSNIFKKSITFFFAEHKQSQCGLSITAETACVLNVAAAISLGVHFV